MWEGQAPYFYEDESISYALDTTYAQFLTKYLIRWGMSQTKIYLDDFVIFGNFCWVPMSGNYEVTVYLFFTIWIYTSNTMINLVVSCDNDTSHDWCYCEFPWKGPSVPLLMKRFLKMLKFPYISESNLQASSFLSLCGHFWFLITYLDYSNSPDHLIRLFQFNSLTG